MNVFLGLDENVRWVICTILAIFFVLGLVNALGSKWWADITQAPNGRYVPLRLFKAVCFLLGAMQVGVAMVLDFLIHTEAGAPVSHDKTAGFALLASALAGQLAKSGEDYFNRKTRDAEGNPLATPPENAPPNPAPELMPGNEKIT